MKSKLLTIGSILILLEACATTSAPKGWLEEPETMQRKSFGGWITVNGNSPNPCDGELIAVNSDTIFVMTPIELRAIPTKSVYHAKLTAYQSHQGELGAWTVLGTLSTLSHGVGLIFTAPAWLLFGSIATSAQSHVPEIIYPKKPWGDLKAFARFPQGLSNEIDRSALKPKSLSAR